MTEPADAGGDPACWMHLLCPECGRLAGEDDTGARPTHCPDCGAELDTDG